MDNKADNVSLQADIVGQFIGPCIDVVSSDSDVDFGVDVVVARGGWRLFSASIVHYSNITFIFAGIYKAIRKSTAS